MTRGRFARLWDRWDADVASGRELVDLLRDAKDEDLVELLGGESARPRGYERDIVATEILNRLRARHSSLRPTARAVADAVDAAGEAARAGLEPIHRTEEILRGVDQEDLARRISDSADESVAATAAAAESARAHAVRVDETFRQSRLAEQAEHVAAADVRQAAEASLQVAERGAAISTRAESDLVDAGEGEAGAAATAAAQRTRDAAGRALRRAERHLDRLSRREERRESDEGE